MVLLSEDEITVLGLERYLRQGCLLLRGFLGSTPVTVIVPAHAQDRMRQRDILDGELLELLARPRSSHGRGKIPTHQEVGWRIGRRHLHVVYRCLSSDVVLVVTVYQE